MVALPLPTQGDAEPEAGAHLVLQVGQGGGRRRWRNQEPRPRPSPSTRTQARPGSRWSGGEEARAGSLSALRHSRVRSFKSEVDGCFRVTAPSEGGVFCCDGVAADGTIVVAHGLAWR